MDRRRINVDEFIKGPSLATASQISQYPSHRQREEQRDVVTNCDNPQLELDYSHREKSFSLILAMLSCDKPEFLDCLLYSLA